MKAFIFDFDGTVADTLPVCFYAFQSVFKEYDQKDVTEKDIISMFGPSETGIIRENITHPNTDEAIERYYLHYEEKHEELVDNNQQMHDFLSLLKEDGYLLGIVTGKAKRSLDVSLEKLRMKKYFDVFISGDDVVQPKPHPEGILKAIEMLGVSKDAAAFIGDSDADISAGKAAEVMTVGVHWLPTVQSSTFKDEPDHYMKDIHTFKQLFKINKETTRIKVLNKPQ